MSIYDVHGNELSSGNIVSIAVLKGANPSLNDDQLLAKAILQAKEIGDTAVILWDGTDIHFSGQITHICSEFGGIDFNGSKIYMPDYDGGTILSIEPDTSTDVTVSASQLLSSYVSNTALKGKVFRVNGTDVPGMCLGTRTGASGNQALWYSQTVKASEDGRYETGNLFLTPSSGDVVCSNVHDYPTVTFEVCNFTVVSSSTSNMSMLINCTRSNTHLHNVVLTGRSNISTYHDGVFHFVACIRCEIDNISGVNPVQKSRTSGYILGLYGSSMFYVHDINVGDKDGWGAIGANYLTDCTFERCYMDRWDCHYAQFGYNSIRDCVMNEILYGIGKGTLAFDNCVVINTDSSAKSFASLRRDCVGVFDGDIILRGCVFETSAQNANVLTVMNDGCGYAKPSNSSVPNGAVGGRFIRNCKIPSGTQYVFQTGTATTADQPMFANLTYAIEDTVVGSGTTKIHPLGSGQTVTEVQSSDYYGKLS